MGDPEARGASTDSAADVVGPLQDNGYWPLATKPNSKQPVHNDWRHRVPSADDWRNGNGVGVLGGFNGLVPIDIDTERPEVVAAIQGVLPAPLVSVRGRRGFKAFYRDPSGLIGGRKFKDREGRMLCEVLATGQAIVPPSKHPETDLPFTYTSKATLLDTAVDALPIITAAHIEALERALAPWMAAPKDRTHSRTKGAKPPSKARMREYAKAALQGEVDALAAMGKDSGRNRALYEATCKLGRYANHCVLSFDYLERALLKACDANGLLQDDGKKQCRATIESGLHKSLGDELPELEDRDDPKKEKLKPKAALGLVTVCAADRKAKPVDWAWKGRLAKGKVTAIAGEPGAGKSQALIDVTARITTGVEWPNGEGRAPLGSVILFSAEDSIDDTIIPRLIAASADLRQVHIIPAVRIEDGERPFILKVDLAALEALIVEKGDVHLIGFDPLASYTPEINSSQNNEVRSVLDRLSEMADRQHVAVVAIMHYRKEASGKTTSKAMHKVLDSIAFVAGPRMAYAISTDPNDPGQQLFLPIKHNITKKPLGLSYRIAEKTISEGKTTIETSHIVWGDKPVDKTADQAIAEEAASAAKQVLRHAILRTLEECEDEDKGMTPQQIADAVDARPGTVRERLRHMVADSSVYRDGSGRYWHPDRKPPMPGAKPRRQPNGGT